MSNSCSLEGNDPIFKIFKKLLDELSGFVGPAVFPEHFNMLEFQVSEIPNHDFSNRFRMFSKYVESFGVSQTENKRFSGVVDTFKIPKNEIDGFQDFQNWNWKWISPNRSRIIVWSFRATLSVKVPTTQIQIFLGLPGLPKESFLFIGISRQIRFSLSFSYRQATGTPWFRVGVGVGMLMGKGTA